MATLLMNAHCYLHSGSRVNMHKKSAMSMTYYLLTCVIFAAQTVYDQITKKSNADVNRQELYQMDYDFNVFHCIRRCVKYAHNVY